MKQKIYLKRQSTAPIFKHNKGLYPNAILKIERITHEFGKELELNFTLYAHDPLEKTLINLRIVFDGTLNKEVYIDEVLTDIGHPDYDNAVDTYIDIDELGVYLTAEYGKLWFLHQERVILPNDLGETKLFTGWEFMNETEIAALAYA